MVLISYRFFKILEFLLYYFSLFTILQFKLTDLYIGGMKKMLVSYAQTCQQFSANFNFSLHTAGVACYSCAAAYLLLMLGLHTTAAGWERETVAAHMWCAEILIPSPHAQNTPIYQPDNRLNYSGEKWQIFAMFSFLTVLFQIVNLF